MSSKVTMCEHFIYSTSQKCWKKTSFWIFHIAVFTLMQSFNTYKFSWVPTRHIHIHIQRVQPSKKLKVLVQCRRNFLDLLMQLLWSNVNKCNWKHWKTIHNLFFLHNSLLKFILHEFFRIDHDTSTMNIMKTEQSALLTLQLYSLRLHLIIQRLMLLWERAVTMLISSCFQAVFTWV